MFLWALSDEGGAIVPNGATQYNLTFSKFKVVLNGMHGLSTSQEKNVRKQLFAHFPIHLLSSAPESHTRTAMEMESQGEFIGYIVFGSLRTFGQV